MNEAAERITANADYIGIVNALNWLVSIGKMCIRDSSPRLFGVQIGYPETLVTNFQLGPIPVHVGAGLAYRIDEDSASMVRAKFEFGLEKDINIAIVYLRGYIYAGADGAYYFDGPDADRIALELYLKLSLIHI